MVNGKWSWIWAVVVFGMMEFSVVPAVAQDCPQFVGSIGTPGTSYVVDVVGNHAYVADGGGGLRVIDVSDPASPVEVGFLGACDARGLAALDSYVYVACRGTVSVIDVSNPANPNEVGVYDNPGEAFRLDVVGTYAYVAANFAGLRVVDVSNPASPNEVGDIGTPGDTWEVAVSGDYAYVADYSGSLRVIDVSNPTSPVEAGFVATPLEPAGVTVSGDYANRIGARRNVVNFLCPLKVSWKDR